MKPVVYLCMPYSGRVEMAAAHAFFNTATRGAVDAIVDHMGCSLLCKCFNELWARALNAQGKYGFTHFAMLHSDIVPEEGWLDTLVAEQQRTKADVVSCVVPIKSGEGLTSTAIDSLHDPWVLEKRLTMREVMQLPETFSAADCGFPDRRLLVNTGCWVADFTRPWRKEIHFRIRDRIITDETGAARSEVMSEDWLFSRDLAVLGGKVLATRKVQLRHVGNTGYTNFHAWGTLERDYDRVNL